MRQYPEHEDIQLVDNDHTPDMRKPPAATEGFSKFDHQAVTTTTKEIQP